VAVLPANWSVVFDVLYCGLVELTVPLRGESAVLNVEVAVSLDERGCLFVKRCESAAGGARPGFVWGLSVVRRRRIRMPGSHVVVSSERQYLWNGNTRLFVDGSRDGTLQSGGSAWMAVAFVDCSTAIDSNLVHLVWWYVVYLLDEFVVVERFVQALVDCVSHG
jgi:hypothetical protein